MTARGSRSTGVRVTGRPGCGASVRARRDRAWFHAASDGVREGRVRLERRSRTRQLLMGWRGKASLRHYCGLCDSDSHGGQSSGGGRQESVSRGRSFREACVIETIDGCAAATPIGGSGSGSASGPFLLGDAGRCHCVGAVKKVVSASERLGPACSRRNSLHRRAKPEDHSSRIRWKVYFIPTVKFARTIFASRLVRLT